MFALTNLLVSRLIVWVDLRIFWAAFIETASGNWDLGKAIGLVVCGAGARRSRISASGSCCIDYAIARWPRGPLAGCRRLLRRGIRRAACDKAIPNSHSPTDLFVRCRVFERQVFCRPAYASCPASLAMHRAWSGRVRLVADRFRGQLWPICHVLRQSECGKKKLLWLPQKRAGSRLQKLSGDR
jgi:hypothetical protein